MPRFVVRDDFPLLRAHHALLFETRDQAIDRLVEVLRADFGLVSTRGKEGRLVDEIRQVGSGKAGGPRGDDLQVDLR